MPKKKRTPTKPNHKYALYEASKPIKRKNSFCPKCGAGVFMAQHKDRLSCGKCHYSEFKK